MPVSSQILAIGVRRVGSQGFLAALRQTSSSPREEDRLEAFNLPRIKHDSSAAVIDKFTASVLDEYLLVAPKIQVVVAACIVHERRHSDATAIDESGQSLRMTL